MNKPRVFDTLRARFEVAQHQHERGLTGDSADLNQLTITEAMIEIMATLDEISANLAIIAGSASPAPAEARKAAAQAVKGK